MPSNEGRGYVLRRIIRRAIRFGQTLGLSDEFLYLICRKVIEVMGTHFRELVQSKDLIEGVVSNEERRFSDTFHYSMRVLSDEIEELKAKGNDTIPGELAFKLYDTYGLPVDMVEDVARDENLTVDMAGYEKAMSRQRKLSQASWKGSGEAEIPEAFRSLLARGVKSRFVGYHTLVSEAQVTALLAGGKETTRVDEGSKAEVILDQTPFYGKAGGQVGDVGRLLKGKVRFRVTDTLKFDQNLIVHEGVLELGSISLGDKLEAQVEEKTRSATVRNHSATHLLHSALREILGDHVKQAGSLVAPDRLRFDFSHFTQVSADKLMEVESLVNKHIRENLPLDTKEMSKDEAMQTGAMAIFEERYGKTVRLVRIGDDVSMELCGGTHTSRTGDIGLFRIVSESAVAANVRRIEALTGEPALQYDQKLEKDLKAAALLLKSAPDQLRNRIERLLREHKEKDREIEALKSELLSKKSQDLLSDVREIGGIKVIARQMEAASPKELRESADRIKDKLRSGIVLLGAKEGDKVMLTCVVTSDLIDRFKAGDIIKRLSSVVGGKGGGRPDMAQGGGSKPERLGKAIESLYGIIESK
jgi:alanyl-tRNA synthetase